MTDVQLLPGGIDLVEEGGLTVLTLRGEVDSSVVDAWDASGPRRREAGPSTCPRRSS